MAEPDKKIANRTQKRYCSSVFIVKHAEFLVSSHPQMNKNNAFGGVTIEGLRELKFGFIAR